MLRKWRRKFEISSGLTKHFAERRLHLAASVSVLFVHVLGTLTVVAGTELGNVALVARIATNHTPFAKLPTRKTFS